METPAKAPLVSVVLPVYNAEKFLAETLDSLLRQTFTDFEIIAINDGSTDKSLDVLTAYGDRDGRLTIINQENQGVVATANRGITLARGIYIARMDADDISMPKRLEQQVEILETHPGVVLVCGDFEVFDEDGCFHYREFLPTKNTDIKRALYLRNPIANGSTMIRKAALLEAGLFSNTFAEDFHMWMKLCTLGDFASTGSMLYRWRMNTNGLTLTNNHLSVSKGKEYIEERWQQSTPDYVPRQQILREGSWYCKHLGYFGVHYKEVYLNDLTQMAAKFFTHGHKVTALRQLFVVASTGRTGFRIALRRIHTISSNHIRSLRERAPFGRAAYDNQKPETVEPS